MKQEKVSMGICDKCSIPKHVKNVLTCETFGGELKPTEPGSRIVGCLRFKEKNTILLNLKKHWFNYIFGRIKREEYREITPYFCEKFLLWKGEKKGRKFWGNIYRSRVDTNITFINPDTFTFSNGMTPPVPRFEIENKGIEINTGYEKWGAIPGKKYFVLKLGEIVDKENC